VADDPFFLASALAAYQKRDGLDDATLRRRVRLVSCRGPSGGRTSRANLLRRAAWSGRSTTIKEGTGGSDGVSNGDDRTLASKFDFGKVYQA
jgi:hypothetical protein